MLVEAEEYEKKVDVVAVEPLDVVKANGCGAEISCVAISLIVATPVELPYENPAAPAKEPPLLN